MTGRGPVRHVFVNESRIGNVSQQKEEAHSWREKQTEEFRGVRVMAGEEELGGKLRYFAEGFLRETQCRSLIQLAEVRDMMTSQIFNHLIGDKTYIK